MPTELFGPVGAGASVSAPVTPAQGGTGTTTVFTPGSVVFAGAAGAYAQDNANLFFNDTTNRSGFGTNLPSATVEVADVSALAGESLTNPNLTAGASWSVTGDMALAANAATYTHATGVGTLTQAGGTLAIAGLANQLYSFTYTISNLSAFLQIPVVTITTGFALTAVPLVINQAGTHTVIFRSAAVPGNFVINVTSNQAGAFTMDTFSLKHVIGGDLTVNGNEQVNGTLTATSLVGPLTGNASTATTAGTVTTAAQPTITSVGTLSGLTVTAAPTFSALTSGSVPFAGTAGLLSQDNANLFWDNTNKRLGIGAVPGSTLSFSGVFNTNYFALRADAGAQTGFYGFGAWNSGTDYGVGIWGGTGASTPGAMNPAVLIAPGGNVLIGATSLGTSALGVLGIGNGTAPSTSPANMVQMWAEDVSSSSELRVRDEAGNVTTLSGNAVFPLNFQVGGATTALNSPIQWSGGSVPIAVPGVLFTQTADKVTTANAATTLFSTGVGTLTLPANLLLAGRTIRITMSGYVSVATAAGTHTLLLSLGGVTVATGTSPAVLTSVINTGWQATATITCRTTGAGGTVVGGAEFRVGAAAAVAESAIFAANTTTAAANTTGTLVVGLTLNNGAAAGTYTTTAAVVEILN